MGLGVGLGVWNVEGGLGESEGKGGLREGGGLMESEDENMKESGKGEYMGGGNENM